MRFMGINISYYWGMLKFVREIQRIHSLEDRMKKDLRISRSQTNDEHDSRYAFTGLFLVCINHTTRITHDENHQSRVEYYPTENPRLTLFSRN